MDALIFLTLIVLGGVVAISIGYNGFIAVNPREGVVVLSFGAYRGTIDSEGIKLGFSSGT